jgi:mRNA interferase MazF
MPIKRGDVALVLFPDSNLRTAKRRPVLVIQADNLGTGLDQVIVAMISSNLARAGHPSRVTISLATVAGLASGLKMDSVIMTDNLATILNVEFYKTIGSWSDMASVEVALRHTLGL